MIKYFIVDLKQWMKMKYNMNIFAKNQKNDTAIKKLDNFDEDILNAKKHNHTRYNTINESLDILYSIIKYNGKIRLFIFDDYNLIIAKETGKLNNDIIKKENKLLIN